MKTTRLFSFLILISLVSNANAQLRVLSNGRVQAGPVSYTHLDVYKRQLLLFVDAMFRNKCDLRVGLLSVIASFTQLFGYGVGFLRSII